MRKVETAGWSNVAQEFFRADTLFPPCRDVLFRQKHSSSSQSWFTRWKKKKKNTRLGALICQRRRFITALRNRPADTDRSGFLAPEPRRLLQSVAGRHCGVARVSFSVNIVCYLRCWKLPFASSACYANGSRDSNPDRFLLNSRNCFRLTDWRKKSENILQIFRFPFPFQSPPPSQCDSRTNIFLSVTQPHHRDRENQIEQVKITPQLGTQRMS